MRKPAEARKRISALQYFLMRVDFREVLKFLHGTKASWGVNRPFRPDDRHQSQAYRARIQVAGHFEHKASGDTPEAAICNAFASFLATEVDDVHVLGMIENFAEGKNGQEEKPPRRDQPR